jgi:hypothetical protein
MIIVAAARLGTPFRSPPGKPLDPVTPYQFLRWIERERKSQARAGDSLVFP